MSQGSIVTDRDLRRWAISSESDEVYVFLISITHEDLDDTIRVSSDNTTYIGLDEQTKEPIYGTISNGETYYCIPFAFTLPSQSESGEVPRAKIRVDNVSRQLVETIRNTDTVPMCTVNMVFASSPDMVRESFPNFRLTSVTYTASSIEGTLSPADFRAEPVPALNFLPSNNPAMF